MNKSSNSKKQKSFNQKSRKSSHHQNNKFKKQNTSQSSILDTEKEQKLSLSNSSLLDNLLRLQNDLAQKINSIKQQKILVLEEYSRQYDKYAELQLEYSKNKLAKVQKQDYLNPSYILKNFSKGQVEKLSFENKKIEDQNKLKRILMQKYETQESNNCEESLFASSQLQQLNQLLKLNKKSKFEESHFKNTAFQYNFSQNIKIGSDPTSNKTTVQQIYYLSQLMQNVLCKKITLLQSHHRLKNMYQEESIASVNSLIRKRAFLQKQISEMNQTIRQYKIKFQMQQKKQQLRNEQNNFGNIKSLNKLSNQYLSKWEKIEKYNDLKQKFNRLSKDVQFKKERINLESNKEQQDPQNSQRQQFQKLQQDLKQLGVEQRIIQLSKKIKEYEQFISNENNEKQQLMNDIENKNKQFKELKRQNILMQKMMKLVV